MKKILLTGMAGFIGSHLAARLVREGMVVFGLDNLNHYYDMNLKFHHLNRLGFDFRDEGEIAAGEHRTAGEHISFARIDLRNGEDVHSLFREVRPDAVVHLAAQAGVRYSITEPLQYISNNVDAFAHILEACRAFPVRHLVYASSSSVYGLNARLPYAEDHFAVHPVSLYGATKKSNELMAHAYAALYNIPATGLRFFTVYGPGGRPDMSPMIFARQMMKGEEIRVFNHGKMKRDFTYIDDIVEGIREVLLRPPEANPDWDASRHSSADSRAPYRILNIGNGHPRDLGDYIDILEKALKVKARRKMMPMQKGDVVETSADTTRLRELTGFCPSVPLEEGIPRFVSWYRQYHGLEG